MSTQILIVLLASRKRCELRHGWSIASSLFRSLPTDRRVVSKPHLDSIGPVWVSQWVTVSPANAHFRNLGDVPDSTQVGYHNQSGDRVTILSGAHIPAYILAKLLTVTRSMPWYGVMRNVPYSARPICARRYRPTLTESLPHKPSDVLDCLATFRY